MTVDLPAPILRNALSAALLAAGADQFLPVLNAVQVTKAGNEMVFRATDRYRLVKVTVTLDSPPEGDWKVLLRAADVKQIVAALPKSGGAVATVGMADDRFSVEVPDGPSMNFGSLDGDFPKVDQIIPAVGVSTPLERIGFRPKHLADCAKMPGRRKDEPVRFRFNGEGKPAVSEWSDGSSDYVYVLMPVRLDS